MRCHGLTVWWGKGMVEAGWQEDLEDWLDPFLVAMGHRKRRLWAPVYLQGLIGPGECREPAADRGQAWPAQPRPAPSLCHEHDLGR
jgi:hypothetical protein